MDQEVEYRLKFTNDPTGALEAKAQFEELNKTVGADQTAAVEKTGSAYKKWFKEAKEGVHGIHAPIKLLHMALGEIALAVMVAQAAWAFYKGTQEDVVKVVGESYDKHMDLIRAMKEVEKAGAKLTKNQESYKDSLERTADVEGGKMTDARQKQNAAISLKISKLEQDLQGTNKYIEANKKLGVVDDENEHIANNLYAAIQKLKVQYGENVTAIDAYRNRSKGLAEDLEKQKKAAADAAAANEEQLKAEIKHNDDMTQSAIVADQEKLKNKKLSNAHIKAVIDDEARIEVENLKRNMDLQMKIIQDHENADLDHKKKYEAQKLALLETTASREEAIKRDSASKKAAIDTASMEHELEVMQTVTHATAEAYAQRIAAGDTYQAAAQAAAAQMIRTVADEAAKEIEIKGLAAAGDAFQAAGNPYLGAIEAAGVLAWYSALAAGVGAVGGAISNSMMPSSSKPSSSSPSGSGSPSSGSSTTSSPASSTGTGVAPSSPGGGGGGEGTLSVALIIGDEVILRIIQRASFDGRLQISANAIVG